MSDYSEFFFGSRASVVEIETMELSHPSFSQVYYLVRNAVQGITATLETSATVAFTYYPMKITQTESATNLDQTMQIAFGDLGAIVPQEIDRIRIADTFLILPELIYRTFRSDDLSKPLYGPVRFQVTTSPRQKTGCTLNIAAPRLNQNGTGERYDMNRFPGLRAF